MQVYTRDEHPPPHVLVEKAGAVIKVMLGENEVEYHSSKDDKPRSRERDRAVQIVADNLAACWATWKEYVGERQD